MSYMQRFQRRVREYGDVWYSNNVKYDVIKGGLRARYMPRFPLSSEEDRTIICDAQTGVFRFLRGENYGD